MADNAIDKLFDEIRAAHAEIEAIKDAEEALEAERQALRGRHIAAIKKRDVLDVTLRKHIHEEMPVVQAKMVAHEELKNSRNSASSAQTNAATSASQTAVNAQLASMGSAIFKSSGRII